MNSPREILARGPELKQLLEAAGADSAGAATMHRKAAARVIRVDGVKAPAANILKQELLSMGGECSNHREVILGKPERCTVHLIADESTLRRLPQKMRAQPFGLKKLAEGVVALLDGQARRPRVLSHARGELQFGARPLICGILNVTSDSFSDGGQWLDPEAAVEKGLSMAAQGADIIDVGGESTRPGSAGVSAVEESNRTTPVIRELARHTNIPLSIDTQKADVAAAALEAGAVMVNDVSALGDAGMAEVVAQSGAALVLMHMRGEPATMQADPRYEDCVDEVYRWLEARLEAAVEAGVSAERIALDPGIGFGKRVQDNTELIRRVGELHSLSRPLMLGASRKSFIGALTGESDPARRLEGSLAAAARGAEAGVQILRVHDVEATRRFLDAYTPLHRRENRQPALEEAPA
ncbi:dihydropteroate synthase [bacterium]|nr:dihydropteroate synthase [bacterium]